MARANVPQFGEWEEEGNVPYTVYFEKARKNKGGKIINPNDPQENPEMFANAALSANPPSRFRVPQEEPIGRGSNKTARQQLESREDGEFRQFADSPARNRNGGRPIATESPHHQYGGRGTGLGRPSRPSLGSEHSIDRSPLHPQLQAKQTGRGNGSPFLEGKRSIETPNGTPGRSRLKPKARDEANARDVIPQFGAWDVNDPQSADNFTYIFGQNAKGSSNRDANSAASPYNSPQRKPNDDEKLQRCCFPWGKK